jgi:hypothetical protein
MFKDQTYFGMSRFVERDVQALTLERAIFVGLIRNLVLLETVNILLVEEVFCLLLIHLENRQQFDKPYFLSGFFTLVS